MLRLFYITFALYPVRRNENVNKYFISSSGDRTHNQSISHFMPLRHDWPQFDVNIINEKELSKVNISIFATLLHIRKLSK